MTTFYDQYGNLTPQGIRFATSLLVSVRCHMKCTPTGVPLPEIERLAKEVCGAAAGQLMLEKIRGSNNG